MHFFNEFFFKKKKGLDIQRKKKPPAKGQRLHYFLIKSASKRRMVSDSGANIQLL